MYLYLLISKVKLINNLMAPRAGLEPATDRLTADCSTTELPRNTNGLLIKKRKKKQVKYGGSERNRTAVQGFAGPYITTLPPSQIFWTINLLLTSSQLIKIIR